MVDVVLPCIEISRCYVAMHWASCMLCCYVMNLVEVVLPCSELDRCCVAMYCTR